MCGVWDMGCVGGVCVYVTLFHRPTMKMGVGIHLQLNCGWLVDIFCVALN